MHEEKPPSSLSDKRVASRSEIDEFLAKVERTIHPNNVGNISRLLFAIDATASREPTWDQACHLQNQMFTATTELGDLHVQLCHYGGFNQFNASEWCLSANALMQAMTRVHCLGGHTQILKVLEHAIREHSKRRLKAVVFIGDAIEENQDQLCHLAGKLGVLGVPLFIFHEGTNQGVRSVFKQMAELSGGAYAPFNLASASELKELLSAVAIFATGGRAALQQFEQKARRRTMLTSQLKD